MANFMAAVNRISPAHIVAIQLKIFTPVGMPISMVTSEKIESATAPIPTANIWWAHTPKPSTPIIMPE